MYVDRRLRPKMTNLYGATAAVLHDVADMSQFSTRSDERGYVVVVQFLQLHTKY